MSVSINKLFVNYKGTKANFEAAIATQEGLAKYANKIVFIENGKCIYAKGSYYGNVAEAIAGLNYFSSIKVGEKVATASGSQQLTIAATDPQVVEVNVSSKGLTFGLNETFVSKVDTAAAKAAAAAVKADVDQEIEEINAAIEALQNALGFNGEGNDSIAALLANLGQRITDEETARANADNALQGNIDKKADKTALDQAVETLNASIAQKVSQSDYNTKVAALEQADIDNLAAAKSYSDGHLATAKTYAEGQAADALQSAKSYADTLVMADGKSKFDAAGSADIALESAKLYTDGKVTEINNAASELEGRVATNEGAIAKLDGDENTVGSVKKQIKDAVAAEAEIARAAEQANAAAIAAVKADVDYFLGDALNKENAEAVKDTLKEIQDYIDSNVSGAAGMTASIKEAKDAADKAQGEVDALEEVVAGVKATADAAATQASLEAEISRADAAEKANAAAIKAISDDYLKKSDKAALEGSINTVSQAVATEKSRAEGVESGLNTRLGNVEKDYLKASDKTELQGNIDTVSGNLSTLSGTVSTLSQTVETNKTNAETGIQEAKSAASAADKKAADAQSYAEGVEGSLNDHINDTVKHITAAERTAWSAAESNAKTYAKTYADSLASNYDADGAADDALVAAKAYTDALANGAVKTNTDDIDAIEALLNNPWEEYDA